MWLNELPPRSSTPSVPRRPSARNSHAPTSLASSPSGSSSTDDDDSDSDDSSSDDGSEYWSSSASSNFRLSSSPHLRPVATSSPRGPHGNPPRAQSRSSLKLSIAYLRARQSLQAESYESLASALRTLSALLPHLDSTSDGCGWDSVSIFVPILERFSRDLAEVLSKKEIATREARRAFLAKEDAKALVALKQKWSRLRGVGERTGATDRARGKEKEKDHDLSWIDHVQALVKKNPPPDYISDSSHLLQTQALLRSVESVLLPSCSIPRISLSNLGLTSPQLSNWTSLRNISHVIFWYISFTTTSTGETQELADSLLQGIKSLDLSRNSLHTFPGWLPLLFPQLETLSLSHNRFYHLPPSIMLFSSLERLRTHGNHLVQSDRALLPLRIDHKKEAKRGRGTQANSKRIMSSLMQRPSPTSDCGPVLSESASMTTRTLFRISVETILGAKTRPTVEELSLLPPHLSRVLTDSYRCPSCREVILSTVSDSDRYIFDPLYERIHFVNPAISLPKSPSSSARTQQPRANSEQYEEDNGFREREGEVTPDRRESSTQTESLASFEQLLLLTIYHRYDSQPPPLVVPSTSSRRPGSRSERYRDNHETRRRQGLPTLVIGGDGDEGAGGGVYEGDEAHERTINPNQWRFCVPCAKAHLGVKGSTRECQCFVCREERKVRGQGIEDSEEATWGPSRVLRWLRRRERLRGS